MFYYALVDTNNICTAVYAMPAAISGASYVEITETLYNDPTLIGKKYVNGEWVEVTVYYYAILDDRNIVTNVYETATEMPAADNLVEITFAEYNDAALIGKYYDRANDAFIDPPVSVLAECSTNEIQYKNAEKYLSDKLDEMDEATAANTAAKHTHDNKEVLDGIKIAIAKVFYPACELARVEQDGTGAIVKMFLTCKKGDSAHASKLKNYRICTDTV